MIQPQTALREIALEDAEFMAQLVSNPAVIQYLPGLIDDKDALAQWIMGLGSSDHEYMITLADGGTRIGESSLTVQGDSAEIGLMIMPEYWRQGYGMEVIVQLTAFAENLHVTKLTATTARENKAAIGLLEKCGFNRQTQGWMVMITPEEPEDKPPEGLAILQFLKKV